MARVNPIRPTILKTSLGRFLIWPSKFSVPQLARFRPYPKLPLRFYPSLGYITAMLDFDECNRARLNKDAAYDGVFFTGVKSTGIYCRPVCRVRKPLAKNVEFFPSAAAAPAAGYRPCLRCRPETAPFSPAWNGTKTTVWRALKLINAGELDNSTVDELCDRLGIGSRHLSRLFQEHLGATPTQVAQTCRVHRAKRLLSDTKKPMTQVALEAGFSSIRRFNTVMQEVYGRSPSDLRQRSRKQGE